MKKIRMKIAIKRLVLFSLLVIVFITAPSLFADDLYDKVEIVSVATSLTTGAITPGYYLTDNDLSTNWAIGKEYDSGWAEIKLSSKTLIHGVSIYGGLETDSEFVIEYSHNNSWIGFTAGYLSEDTLYGNSIYINLLYDRVVTDAIRIRLENAAESYIGDIEIIGADADKLLYKIAPEISEETGNSYLYYPLTNLIDGNTYTSWKAINSHFGGNIFNELEMLSGNNHGEHGRCGGGGDHDEHNNNDTKIEFKLNNDFSPEEIRIYFSEHSKGDVIIELERNGEWEFVEEISGYQREPGWQSIDLSYLNGETISKIRMLVRNSEDHGRGFGRDWYIGGISEFEIWGYGSYTGDGHQSLLIKSPKELIEPYNMIFYLDEDEETLLDNLRLDVLIEGEITENLFAELNVSELEISDYKHINGNTLYSVNIEKDMLWELENFIRIIPFENIENTDILDVIISEVNLLGRQPLYWYTNNIIGEELIHPDSYVTDNSMVDISLGYDVVLKGITLLHDNYSYRKVYAFVNEEWQELLLEDENDYFTEYSVEDIYGDVITTDRIRIEKVSDDEIKDIILLGSPVTDRAPEVEILYPENESFLNIFNLFKFLIGKVDNTETVIKVNGYDVQREGHYFWINLGRLRLFTSAESVITAEAVDTFGRTGTDEVYVYIGSDHRFRLDQPDKIYYTSQDTFLISGRTGSGRDKVTINDEEVNVSRKRFSDNVELVEGLNIITVKSYSKHGHNHDRLQGILIRKVYRYTGDIILKIDSPPSEFYTQNSYVDISGTVQGVGEKTVKINGNEVVLIGNRFNSLQSNLTEGENKFVIEAVDEDGNSVIKDITAIRDTTAPVISDVIPLPGTIINTSTFKVSMKIDEFNPVWIYVNGKVCTKIDEISNTVSTYSVDITQPDGISREILIKAIDIAGNQSVYTYTVVVDTIPPKAFEVIADPAVWTNNNRPTIYFQATDETSGIDHYECRINEGNAVVVQSPYKLPVLEDGINEITVIAYDRAGHSTMSTTQVFIDTIPPESPVNLDVIPGDSKMLLSWEASPADDVVFYKIERQPAFDDENTGIVESDDLSFTDLFVENNHYYSYTVRAVDRAYNESIYTEWITKIAGVGVVEVIPDEDTILIFDNVELFFPNGIIPGSIKEIRVSVSEGEELNEYLTNCPITPTYDFYAVSNENRIIPSVEFSGEYTAKIYYDESKVSQVRGEEDLYAFYFNLNWSKWIRIKSSIANTDENYVIYKCDHFTSVNVENPTYSTINAFEYQDTAYNPLIVGGGMDGKLQISRQTGAVSTYVKEIVIPGLNGFNMEVGRYYNTFTARKDSSLLNYFYDAEQNDIYSEYDDFARWYLQNKIFDIGDYAYSIAPGWRLNMPFFYWNDDGPVVCLENGSNFLLEEMELLEQDGIVINPATEESPEVGSTRTLKFMNRSGTEFILEVEQEYIEISNDYSYELWAREDSWYCSEHKHVDYDEPLKDDETNETEITNTSLSLNVYDHSNDFLGTVTVSAANSSGYSTVTIDLDKVLDEGTYSYDETRNVSSSNAEGGSDHNFYPSLYDEVTEDIPISKFDYDEVDIDITVNKRTWVKEIPVYDVDDIDNDEDTSELLYYDYEYHYYATISYEVNTDEYEYDAPYTVTNDYEEFLALDATCNMYGWQATSYKVTMKNGTVYNFNSNGSIDEIIYPSDGDRLFFSYYGENSANKFKLNTITSNMGRGAISFIYRNNDDYLPTIQQVNVTNNNGTDSRQIRYQLSDDYDSLTAYDIGNREWIYSYNDRYIETAYGPGIGYNKVDKYFAGYPYGVYDAAIDTLSIYDSNSEDGNLVEQAVFFYKTDDEDENFLDVTEERRSNGNSYYYKYVYEKYDKEGYDISYSQEIETVSEETTYTIDVCNHYYVQGDGRNYLSTFNTIGEELWDGLWEELYTSTTCSEYIQLPEITGEYNIYGNYEVNTETITSTRLKTMEIYTPNSGGVSEIMQIYKYFYDNTDSFPLSPVVEDKVVRMVITNQADNADYRKIINYKYDSWGNVIYKRENQTVNGTNNRFYSWYWYNCDNSTSSLIGNNTIYPYNDNFAYIPYTNAFSGLTTVTGDQKNLLLAQIDAHFSPEIDNTGNVNLNKEFKYHYFHYNDSGKLDREAVLKDSINNLWLYRNYEYFLNGQIMANEDNEGHRTEFVYDSNYFLTQVIEKDVRDADGNVSDISEYMGFNWLGNLMWKQDKNGNRTDYVKDILGRTTRVLYPENSCNIVNTETNEIINISDNIPGIRPEVNIIYHETPVQSNSGNTYYFWSEETNSENQKRINYYDTLGNLREVDNENNETSDYSEVSVSFDYDYRGKILIITDGNGNEKKYVYNAAGQVTKEIYPQSNNDSSSRNYNYSQNTVTIVDEEGRTIVEEFDFDGRVLKRTVAGYTTEHYYDSYGNEVITIDGRGNVTRNIYNIHNQLERIIYPESDYPIVENGVEIISAISPFTQYEYNSIGQIVKEEMGYYVMDNGNINSTVISHTINYNSDEIGRLLMESHNYTEYDFINNISTDEITERTIYYDNNGNIVSETDGNNNTVKYRYNSQNKLIQEIYPDGNSIINKYDTLGNIKQQLDQREYRRSILNDPNASFSQDTRMEYFYDDLNRLIRVNLPVLDGETEKPFVQFSYYPNGTLKERIEMDGKIISFIYNARNWLESETHSGDGEDYTIEYTYYKNGNLYTKREPGAAGFDDFYTYFYNEQNKITRIIYPAKNDEYFYYDTNGNLIRAVDGIGITTEYEYDSYNQMINETTAVGTDEEVVTQRCYYNHKGDVSRVIYGTGDEEQMYTKYYDELGRQIREVDNRGNSSYFRYDKTGNIIASLDPEGTISTYDYYTNYLLKEMILSNNGITNSKYYEYDEAGNLVLADNDGVITEYKISTHGNNLEETNSLFGNSFSVSYKYDSAGRVTEIETPDNETVVYNLNKHGHVTGIPGYIDNPPLYDERGFLENVFYANGVLQQYEYDVNGRITNLQYADFIDYSYTYFANNNVSTRSDRIINRTNEYAYNERNFLQTTVLNGSFEIDAGEFSENNIGIILDDFDGLGLLDLPLEQLPDDIIKLDYSAESIVADLGDEYPVKRIILTPDAYENRLLTTDVEIFVSRYNENYSIVEENEYSITKNEETGKIEIILNSPVISHYIKIHNYCDDRDSLNIAVDKSEFMHYRNTLVSVYFTASTIGETFSYNSTGNRTQYQKDVGGYSITNNYQYYSNTDLLKADSQFVYKYDLNGNLIEKGTYIGTIEDPLFVSAIEDWNTIDENTFDIILKGEYWSYEYDLFNRLIKVEKYIAANNALITAAEYTYNASDLRVQKTGLESIEYFVYSGSQLVYTLQEDLSGDREYRKYVYAFGKHIALEKGTVDLTNNHMLTEKYYLHTDNSGSVIAVTDTAGTLIWSNDFYPFGNLTDPSDTFNEINLYTGKDMDEDTGLYYFNARWYDPDTGRFMTGDPVRDMTNWYIYCANNPLRYTDPSGLWTLEQTDDGYQVRWDGEKDLYDTEGNLLSINRSGLWNKGLVNFVGGEDYVRALLGVDSSEEMSLCELGIALMNTVGVILNETEDGYIVDPFIEKVFNAVGIDTSLESLLVFQVSEERVEKINDYFIARDEYIANNKRSDPFSNMVSGAIANMMLGLDIDNLYLLMPDIGNPIEGENAVTTRRFYKNGTKHFTLGNNTAVDLGTYGENPPLYTTTTETITRPVWDSNSDHTFGYGYFFLSQTSTTQKMYAHTQSGSAIDISFNSLFDLANAAGFNRVTLPSGVAFGDVSNTGHSIGNPSEHLHYEIGNFPNWRIY